MSDDVDAETSGPSGFLERARVRAEKVLAEYLAMDPSSIDIVGRAGSLPGMVFGALAGMKDQLNPGSRAAIEEWEEKERQRRRDFWQLAELADKAFRESLPPNWRSPEVEFPELDELERLQQVEGLPLAWVPPNHVLRSLLARRSSASRRLLIAHESEDILAACLKELRRLRSVETKEWRASAREAALTMKDGYWRAGQALAAIALDTSTAEFVRRSYSDATQQLRNNKPTPPGSSDRSLPTWYEVDYPRALLVLHGIYGAFGHYDGRGGEPVPTQFTRHGTVHSMSRRQYTKANALIALMHLVGLLCLIEDD